MRVMDLLARMRATRVHLAGGRRIWWPDGLASIEGIVGTNCGEIADERRG
jgi:hypothetical protein